MAMAAMALLPSLPGGGFSDLFTNRVFLAGFWGWFTAQTLKVRRQQHQEHSQHEAAACLNTAGLSVGASHTSER